MGDWKLRDIRIHRAGLNTMPPLDPVKRSLQRLYLDVNNLISIGPTLYFKGFSHLSEISLQSNSLHTFPDVTPLSHTLSLLFLSYNQIQSIPQNFYMTKFLHISLVRLESNHLSYFDHESISAWPELTHMFFCYNNIRALPYIYGQNKNCSTMQRQDCWLMLHRIHLIAITGPQSLLRIRCMVTL